MQAKSFNTIRRILVTEKAYASANEANTYVFEVDVKATKDDIRGAIKDIYKVAPVRIRTSILRGKVKRTRFGLGKRPNTKKAYVTVADGTSLPVYEEI